MTAFLDVLANLFWPFVISAAAWAIAVCALTEPNDLSRLVKSLTNSEAGAPSTSGTGEPASNSALSERQPQPARSPGH